MEVRRVVAVGGDRVDVYVQDPVGDWEREGFDAGFFAGLPEGRRERGFVGRLEVAAGLEPAVELAVPQEEELGGRGTGDDGAGGDVAGGGGAEEGGRGGCEEGAGPGAAVRVVAGLA